MSALQSALLAELYHRRPDWHNVMHITSSGLNGPGVVLA